MTKPARSDDLAIRCAIVRRMLDAGTPRAAIRHEVTLDSASSDGRADIVVLRPDAIVGVEIKSGRDSLARLGKQRPRYSARFDRIVLVYDQRHAGELGKLGIFGWQGWELCGVNWTKGGAEFDENYWTGMGALIAPVSHWRHRSGHLSARAMLEMLDRSDVVDVARSCAKQIDTRWRALEWLAENEPVGKLRLLISQRLKDRPLNRWEDKFWKTFDALPVPAVAA